LLFLTLSVSFLVHIMIFYNPFFPILYFVCCDRNKFYNRHRCTMAAKIQATGEGLRSFPKLNTIFELYLLWQFSLGFDILNSALRSSFVNSYFVSLLTIIKLICTSLRLWFSVSLSLCLSVSLSLCLSVSLSLCLSVSLFLSHSACGSLSLSASESILKKLIFCIECFCWSNKNFYQTGSKVVASITVTMLSRPSAESVFGATPEMVQ
jgi:hypothetical protein